MFRVFLTNFGYYVDGEFNTLDEAKVRGRKTGFEFTVYRADDLVGSWSIFGGYQDFTFKAEEVCKLT